MIPNYCILDTETGNKKMYHRTAHFKYNPIVAIGMKKGEKEVASDYVWDLVQKLESPPRYNLEPMEHYLHNTFFDLMLKDIDVIVMHNATFDCLHYWKYKGFQDWLLNGGKIWCTMLAEFMLTGQQHTFPGLRSIAVNKYNCQERPKKMEPYWDEGYNTTEIPKHIVIEDVQNDCLDTEKVFVAQYKKATELNMTTLLFARMDGLLGLIEMEYNGNKVDKDLLLTNKRALEQQMVDSAAKVALMSEKYWKLE